MKKQTIAKRITAMLLCALMALSFVACQPAAQPSGSGAGDSTGVESGTDTATDTPKDIVTLTGFGMVGTGQLSLDKAQWYNKYLRENLGVELQFRETAGANLEEILQSLLASGELPDILSLGMSSDANNAAEAGLLLSLDANKDKLPNIFGNAQLNPMIEFCRANVSGGKNELFALQGDVGEQLTVNVQPHLRWDLYKKAGSPEINTLEDYLPALKAMMEIEPESPSGYKNYGISIFAAWDSTNMQFSGYLANMLGVDAEILNKMVEHPADGTGEVTSILDDNSATKRILKFFFDANQMGVLDPDSATQTWETAYDKWQDGAAFFSPWGWAVGGFNTVENTAGEDPKGYAPVIAKDAKLIVSPDQYVGATSRTMAIGAATKHPDEALKFLDWYFSYEGEDVVINLPENVLWEKGEDGMRRISDAGWDILDNDKEVPDGGKPGDALNVTSVYAFTTFTENPATNGQYLSHSEWPSTYEHRMASNKIMQDWSAQNGGALNVYDSIRSSGQMTKAHPGISFIPPMPAEIDAIMKEVGSVVTTNMWKMVYAKDEAEFEALWEDMKTKADGLGMETLQDWVKTEWAKAKADAETYMD